MTGDYVVDQAVDGAWHAVARDGGRVIVVDGWQTLADLLPKHALWWRSPTALSRFRSQFGEPPPSLDLHSMSVATPA